MKASDEVKYPGISVTQTVDPKHEIRKQISATMAVFKKLDTFWLKTACGKRWKLLVYDAVITNTLLYGLESIEHMHAAATLLNTFQLKGLRKKCDYIPHTFNVTIQTPTYTKKTMKS